MNIQNSFLVSLLRLVGLNVFSQERVNKKIDIKQLFDLAIANNPSLAVSKSRLDVASQEIEEAKTNHLPELSTSLSGFYIGDAQIIDKNFSSATRVATPHFGNIFSVEATQLIWKNGVVRKGIQAKTLQQQISSLDYLGSEQNVKLLVLGYYLDLYKMYNQIDVYRQNIALAEKRYDNINKFFDKGMITRNDVIRGELQISNLKLSLEMLENNATIYNEQLIVALGLDENTVIVPDKEILLEQHAVLGLNEYIFSLQNHPSLLKSKTSVDLYQTLASTTKTSMMPSLSAFAGNKLQRPKG